MKKDVISMTQKESEPRVSFGQYWGNVVKLQYGIMAKGQSEILLQDHAVEDCGLLLDMTGKKLSFRI
ncbi:hypothetical protein Tco_0442332 [Tanacetum coccineum]